ncbi:MAG: hypothetical protein LBR09_01045 [Endomicrobium sp.]|nr:hypothetical protein [Endomicrobium sp.]
MGSRLEKAENLIRTEKSEVELKELKDTEEKLQIEESKERKQQSVINTAKRNELKPSLRLNYKDYKMYWAIKILVTYRNSKRNTGL